MSFNIYPTTRHNAGHVTSAIAVHARLTPQISALSARQTILSTKIAQVAYFVKLTTVNNAYNPTSAQHAPTTTQ